MQRFPNCDQWFARAAAWTTTHPRLFLGLVLLAGFALRLDAVLVGHGFHYFAINDELGAYEYALAWLAGEEWASYLAQPTFAGGQVPGPLWTLFCVLLLKAGGNSPDGALLWMAVLNTLAIVGVYWLARQLLELRWAQLSTLLFALLPWPVYYSYGLWNPIPLALLGATLFLALWQTLQQERSRAVFLVAVLAAAIPQFHMVGIFYIPAILLLLLLAPVRLNRRWLMAGVIAAALLYLPYVLGEIRHDWQNLHGILQGEGERGFSASVLKVISAPATVLSLVPGRWAGELIDETRRFGDTVFGSWWLLLGLSLLSLVMAFVWIGSFARQLWTVMRRNGWRWAAGDPAASRIYFLGVLLLVPLVLFGLTGHNYATRYTILILPLLVLLPALFLQRLRSASARCLGYALLALIVMTGSYQSVAFFRYQAGMIAEGEKFLPSFRKLENVYRQLRTASGAGVRIVLQPDPAIDRLDPLNRKLILALPHYLRIVQTWREPLPADAPQRLYSLRLVNFRDAASRDSAAGAPAQQPEAVIYRSHNLVIVPP